MICMLKNLNKRPIPYFLNGFHVFKMGQLEDEKPSFENDIHFCKHDFHVQKSGIHMG